MGKIKPVGKLRKQGKCIQARKRLHCNGLERGNNIKQTKDWHFKFSHCKRFVFNRNHTATSVHVRGEVFYTSDIGEGKQLVKKGCKIQQVLLSEVVHGAPVKQAKLKDIENLLIKHYGENWRAMPGNDFLERFLDHGIVGPNDAPEEHFCEAHEEDISLRV